MIAVVAALCLPLTMMTIDRAVASDPTGTTFTPPPDEMGAPDSVVKTWTGSIPLTGAVLGDVPCTAAMCDSHLVHLQLPADYWTTHDGSVKLEVSWDEPTFDLDVRVLDAQGNLVKDAATSDDPEKVDLGELAPGDYTVEVASFVAQPAITYSATMNLTSTLLDPAMILPEDRDSLPGLARGGWRPTATRLAPWASRKTSFSALSRSVTSGSSGSGSPTCWAS